jgi:Flp pilus assembly protein TadD
LSLVHQGRVAEAIPILERAVQLDPGDGAVRLYLGNAFMAVKRPDAAEEHYRAGWRLVPESPTLPKALAGAMVLSNRPSEALAVLEEARRRHPDDEEIEAAYADLKRGLTRSNR